MALLRVDQVSEIVDDGDTIENDDRITIISIKSNTILLMWLLSFIIQPNLKIWRCRLSIMVCQKGRNGKCEAVIPFLTLFSRSKITF